MFFDIAFGFVILLFSIRGAVTGLVRQAFGLIRIVISIVGAVVLAPYFSPMMSKFPLNPSLSWWLSFLLVFFGVWFFIFCLGLSFSMFLQSVEVTSLDRLVGFIVGAICGFVVCVVIVMFLIAQPFIDVMRFKEDSYILQAFIFYSEQIRSYGIQNFKFHL